MDENSIHVPIEIRPERLSDFSRVRRVVEDAFGRAAEADLIDRLRDDAVSISSIVAVENDQLVGHALFSRVWIDSDGASIAVASLAPVSVRSDRQRRGIGSALIVRGIEECRAAGWPAIIVVGHTGYYPRFGFSAALVSHLESPYAGTHFMGLELRSGALTRVFGRVRYPAAFGK
jgi:putative acetyltransferase